MRALLLAHVARAEAAACRVWAQRGAAVHITTTPTRANSSVRESCGALSSMVRRHTTGRRQLTPRRGGRGGGGRNGRWWRHTTADNDRRHCGAARGHNASISLALTVALAANVVLHLPAEHLHISRHAGADHALSCYRHVTRPQSIRSHAELNPNDSPCRAGSTAHTGRKRTPRSRPAGPRQVRGSCRPATG